MPWLPSDPQCISYSACVSKGGTIASFPNAKKCIRCGPYSEFNVTSLKCACNTDYLEDSNGQCLSLAALCPPNQKYFNGSCYTEAFKIEKCDEQT